jgi:hypothetical protein
VLLPTLSAHAAWGNAEALWQDLARTLRVAGALSLLAGGALWFGRETLVPTMLARGAFGEASVGAVGAALQMFASLQRPAEKDLQDRLRTRRRAGAQAQAAATGFRHAPGQRQPDPYSPEPPCGTGSRRASSRWFWTSRRAPLQ